MATGMASDVLSDVLPAMAAGLLVRGCVAGS
jgi:hypothetical protein